MELRNQVSQSGVHVDVDAPKGQDLAQIMAEIRAKYEKMAQKNQEELKTWHESQVDDRPSPSPIQKDNDLDVCFNVSFFQITEVQTQVSQSSEALKGAQTEMNDLRRQIQTLEIELESQRSLVSCTVSERLITLSTAQLSTLTSGLSRLLCRHELHRPATRR